MSTVKPRILETTADRARMLLAIQLERDRMAEAMRRNAGKGVTLERRFPKVGRNEPCPCKSGKKFKRCHGVLEAAALSNNAKISAQQNRRQP